MMMSQSSAHHDARARAFIDEKSFEPYYYSNGSRSTCVCEASVSFLLHDIVSIVLTNHQPSSMMGRIRAALVLLATMSPAYVEAFQGWTNGGRPRPFALFATPASRKGRATPSATDPSRGNGVTSALISQLAIAALKLRLAGQTGIKVDVAATSQDLLLRQRVGGVTVRGRGWESPLGLTCRAIEATVQECDLDISAVITRRKLILTTPARGTAMIGMTADDFGSFISHPLMKPPTDLPGMKFASEGVTIDPGTGTVAFDFRFREERWRCHLRRGTDNGRKAIVEVSSADGTERGDDLAAGLSRTMTDFFNELVFELDGTFLSFRDLMVTDRGGGATVMLSLSITVKKFPSPGMAF